MSTLDTKVQDFLTQRRIAVAGVSPASKGRHTATGIYRKLKDNGYQVFPVNPHVEAIEDERCYPNLQSIPGGVDGVVIVARPEVTEAIVRQCPDAGVSRVWMHQSFAGAGSSVSQDAVQFCQAHNISVIAGACPMMYCQEADVAHKCLRWVLGVTGGLPR